MQRIQRLINYVNKFLIIDKKEINQWDYQRAIYQSPNHYKAITNITENISIGDHLINEGETIFLRKQIDIPKTWLHKTLGLKIQVGQERIQTNHEGLVSINGKPYHGIDRNRDLAILPDLPSPSLHIEIELFNPIGQPKDQLNAQNEPAEHSPAPLYLLNSELVIINEPLEKLLFTIKTYAETAKLLQDNDLRKLEIIHIIYQVKKEIINADKKVLFDKKYLQQLRSHIKDKLTHIKTEVAGKIHMVGQSHIDLAWLWPYRETVRKLSRTFSTMTAMLEQFPNFTFAQSQPQAYALVKEYYPELYKRIKTHIQSGKWEIVGGMWVEPDLNIPSGESLVRQLLYGLKFYQDEFGVKPKIEWLPDTFGYCASLPQLLKKSGIEYFMTTKMNWNDTNQFPYDLFYWEGIDGSRIISYLNHGVNEYTHPKEVQEHWNSYRQKDIHPEQMLLYGHGDGGGGVTREMLNYLEHSEELPGLPKLEYSTAHNFFETIKEQNPNLPTWVGDMYLELHRGTYTTQAKNKKWNRKAEVLYRDAEIWTSLASLYENGEKTTELEEGWKLLLLNQFHDIIPGTSIPEVHQTSAKDYEKIFFIGEQLKDKSTQSIVSKIDTSGHGIPVVLLNSLSWDRSEVVTIKGGLELKGFVAYNSNKQPLLTDEKLLNDKEIELSIYIPHIPKLGYQTIWLAPGEKTVKEESPIFNGQWETKYYKMSWNENGEINRLYDKEAEREVLKEAPANQFQLFHDRPLLWDAWDIDPNFENQRADTPKLQSVEVVMQGKTKDILQFEWNISHSNIQQQVILYHHSKRIDFKTKVDWHEEHKLLKVSFPVNILAHQATYEIPFGTIDRPTHNNTSWEQAQFEVCGHRFADLSEGNYGVSLLNDSKYGYDIKGNQLRLSLLRSSKWPDPTADLGKHQFTYSLYPHKGDWRRAQTTKEGFALNNPVTVICAEEQEGELPSEHSFLDVDSESVILETIKHNEESDHLILRFYESTGSHDQAIVECNFPIKAAEETNLLEESIHSIPVEKNQFIFSCKPYEVKTIQLKI